MPPYIRETITRFLDDFRRRSTEITCDGFPSYFIAIPLSAHVSTEQWKPFRAHSSLWAFDRGCTSNYMRQLVSAVVHATKACPIFFFTFLSLFFFFLLFTKKSQTHSLRDYRQTRSLSRPNPHLFGVTVAIPPFIRFSRRLWGREGGKVYLVYPRRNCIFQRVTMAYHARFPRRE